MGKGETSFHLSARQLLLDSNYKSTALLLLLDSDTELQTLQIHGTLKEQHLRSYLDLARA